MKTEHVKHKKFAITAAIIGVIVAAVTGVYFVSTQTTLTELPPPQDDQEISDARDIAQKYIVTSPTFAFDGDINALLLDYLGSTKSIPPQHMFEATYESTHGGFGNREGQMLTQVITPHKVGIIVSEGNVISAVTDEVWDELNHQYVLKKPESKLVSHDGPIVPFDGVVSDYSSLVAAIQSRGILVEYLDEIAAESSSFSVPTKVISVGGVDVQVFEFQSESDAKTASLTVSEDGTEIGTSIIRWIDMPHFYTNSKLIVLYVGQNQEILNLLESLLGTQFAGM